MVFVDDLGMELILNGLIALTLFYLGVRTYFRYRTNGNDKAMHELKSSAPLIGVFGFIVLLMGTYGETVWPLMPGTAGAKYNILFYDPTMLFGIALVSFALSLAFNLRTQYVGLYSMVAGAVTIYYGIIGYNLGMTSSPIALLLLYGAFGAAGIFTFPATLVIDKILSTKALPSGVAEKKEVGIPASTMMVAANVQRVAGEAKYRLGIATNFALALFLLFLIGAAVASFYIGLNEIPSHLANVP